VTTEARKKCRLKDKTKKRKAETGVRKKKAGRKETSCKMGNFK
jgi:hypothetical protein